MDWYYAEDAEILDSRYMDETESDHEVQLKVKGLSLICFDPSIRGNFVKGNKMKVNFTLLSRDATPGKKVKSITPIESFRERGWWSSNFEINGELVAIQWISFLREGKIQSVSNGVVDCGVFVNNVSLPNDHHYEIRDYVQADGRLDVYDLRKK